MKKSLFLEHFYMIFTFLHGRAYNSSKNYLFILFLYSFYCKKAAKNEKKYIVEENSENDEEHN